MDDITKRDGATPLPLSAWWGVAFFVVVVVCVVVITVVLVGNENDRRETHYLEKQAGCEEAVAVLEASYPGTTVEWQRRPPRCLVVDHGVIIFAAETTP